MGSFLISFEKTNKTEGGYTNNHTDNGNWTSGKVGLGVCIGTNGGISAPVLSSYLGRTATITDMINMTLQVRQDIYRKNYWNKIRGDEINAQILCDKFYDIAVNQGVSEAIKNVQEDIGVPLTGIMDDFAIKKLNDGI